MKVNKSLTLKLTKQEAMDLRSLLYIAKDSITAEDFKYSDANPLKTFAEKLLDEIYL